MRRVLRRLSPAVALAAVVATTVVAPADATRSRARPRAKGPSVPRLVAEPTSVAAGGVLVLEGNGFPSGAEIVLRAGPPRSEAARIGRATSGSRGRFRARITIRRGVAPGRYVAVACHAGCRVKATAPFTVVRTR